MSREFPDLLDFKNESLGNLISHYVWARKELQKFPEKIANDVLNHVMTYEAKKSSWMAGQSNKAWFEIVHRAEKFGNKSDAVESLNTLDLRIQEEASYEVGDIYDTLRHLTGEDNQ